MMELIAIGQIIGFCVGVYVGYRTMEWWLGEKDD